MLSASHNAMPDNGIKFFTADGNKLPDHVEAQIETRLRETWDRPVGDAVGRIVTDTSADGEYVSHLLTSLPVSLKGLTVVVDGANGAASHVGPLTYREAGADVIEIHCEPDGYNINHGCGRPISKTCRKQSSSMGRIWASHTTGTQTVAWPSTPRATSSTVTS